MRFLVRSIVVVVLGVWAAFVYWPREALSDSQVSAESFKKLHATILPSEGEDPFSTIPWETSLWEARQKAAKLGRPILLWEMDGHPLGCG